MVALQLSCRSTLVKDVAVWSVNNPHLSVQYERRAAGSLAVDVWIDINKLDELNAVQDVCKRGFHMPDNGSGMEVVTGNIRFDMEGPEVHHYLLCTVAVGRSFVLDDPSARRELAPGYDSLYMHLADNSGAMEALDGPDMYRHQYVVFDAAQLLPRYVVHFTYHPRERFLRTPVAPINLNEIKARVADALSLLGPAAPAATEKMLSDIGTCAPPRPRRVCDACTSRATSARARARIWYCTCTHTRACARWWPGMCKRHTRGGGAAVHTYQCLTASFQWQ
ncbi:hypothetical protein EON67_12385, partial [archaeon]